MVVLSVITFPHIFCICLVLWFQVANVSRFLPSLGNFAVFAIFFVLILRDCVCVYVYLCMYVWLSVCLSVSLSACVCLSVYVRLPVCILCLSVYLSICLSVYLYVVVYVQVDAEELDVLRDRAVGMEYGIDRF